MLMAFPVTRDLSGNLDIKVGYATVGAHMDKQGKEEKCNSIDQRDLDDIILGQYLV